MLYDTAGLSRMCLAVLLTRSPGKRHTIKHLGFQPRWLLAVESSKFEGLSEYLWKEVTYFEAVVSNGLPQGPGAN